MPSLTKDIPEVLKPYYYHGLSVDTKEGNKEAIGVCPFCDKDKKFYLNLEDEKWQCFSCRASGRKISSFFEKILEASAEPEESWLAHRRLLTLDVFHRWGLKRSILTQELIVPGYRTNDNKVSQLYRYVQTTNGKFRLFATPNISHGIFGLGEENYKPTQPTVFLCEGPWDGMALSEVINWALENEEVAEPLMESYYASIKDVTVLATPGCNVFNEAWCSLFAEKDVCLLFDNDHEKVHAGSDKVIPSAGYEGMKRIAKILMGSEKPPKSIRYLAWGGPTLTHDPELPHGMDVRDFLTQGRAVDQMERRVILLEELLTRLLPVPQEWIAGVTPGTNKTGSSVNPVPCKNWLTLQQSWRKALKWTDGLDKTLSVMLACITSTRAVGDQLWVKVIGPPSCIDGRAMVTVEETQVSGAQIKIELPLEDFYKHYHSQESKERAVTYKILGLNTDTKKPEFFQVTDCLHTATRRTYDVITSQGFVLYATMEHELLTPCGYKPLMELQEDDVVFIVQKKKVVLDSIVSIGKSGNSRVCKVYDIRCPGPYHNFVANGVVVHNCGKSVLCEAISVSNKYVKAISTFRGFHSGYKSDKHGTVDHSLIPHIRDKTMVTKDGDTLLQAPNLGQILSEARDIYDSVSRAHYRSNLSRDYQGIRMTWILCGTESLRSLDSSELGERFLDCVVVNEMPDDLEEEIGWRVANRVERELAFEADGKPESREGPEMIKAKQLTGGYVNFLRENAKKLLGEIYMTDHAKKKCQRLAKLISYMRARPSSRQEETSQRELSFRLISQLVRLAKCLAVVLNKSEVDADVLTRVTSVALDTSRGRTMRIVKVLYHAGESGMETRNLALLTNQKEEKERDMLKFLREIGVTELCNTNASPGVRTRPRWCLSPVMHSLYQELILPFDIEEGGTYES